MMREAHVGILYLITTHRFRKGKAAAQLFCGFYLRLQDALDCDQPMAGNSNTLLIVKSACKPTAKTGTSDRGPLRTVHT